MATTQAEQERLAKELLDETLREFSGMVPASDLEAIRVLLEMELLCTEEGQHTLRTIAPDPQVARSGDVEKAPSKGQKGQKASGES